MSIKKTFLYTISFQKNNLIDILQLLETRNDLYPVLGSEVISNVKGVKLLDKSHPYDPILEDLEYIKEHIHYKMVGTGNRCCEPTPSMYDEIEMVKKEVEKIQAAKTQLNDELLENMNVLAVLEKLKEGNVNIDDLQNTKYVTTRIGKLSIKQKRKLKYYREHRFVFTEVTRDEKVIWGMYTALNQDILKIDNVFAALEFEVIKIPDFVHGTMEEALEGINELSKKMEEYIQSMDQKFENLKEKYGYRMNQMEQNILMILHSYQHLDYIVDYTSSLALVTFTTRTIEEVEKLIENMPQATVLSLPVDMYEQRNIHSPIVLDNPSVVRPFENFILQKRNDRFDMSKLVTILFMLGSAIILGDIAIGILIFILSYLFKKIRTRKILQIIGISTFVGGLTYGTLFFKRIFTFGTSYVSTVIISIAYFIILIFLISVVGNLIMVLIRKFRGG